MPQRSLDDWLSYIEALHPAEIDMGLDRVRQVAERLNVKRPAPRSVIVAGTNGKGSTCVALETLLIEAGVKVGTTLSPHVERFNERIRIAGEPLADGSICELFAAVEAARKGLDDQPEIELTYFEFACLAALTAFARAGVEVAILEVGLGGRLDAFNIVDADLAVVTSIGLDHQDYLGDDLQQIGREKAGVFRAGQSVVLGQVTESVVEAARELDCEVHGLGVDFHVEERADSWSYFPADGSAPLSDLERGALAPCNCALAIRAALALGIPVSAGVERLSTRTLDGRMQTFSVAGVPAIVDVAHNPAAATFLADQLAIRHPDRRYLAIFGALTGKDVGGIGRALAPLVNGWLTIGTGGSRGQSAERAARLLNEAGCRAEAAGSVARAMGRARSLRLADDGILVLGSFSAAEQARAFMRQLPGGGTNNGGRQG